MKIECMYNPNKECNPDDCREYFSATIMSEVRGDRNKLEKLVTELARILTDLGKENFVNAVLTSPEDAISLSLLKIETDKYIPNYCPYKEVPPLGMDE